MFQQEFDPAAAAKAEAALSPGDWKKVIVEWNATTVSYDSEQRVEDLFAEQVQRTPGAIALVSGEQQLSFSELERRSNQVASWIVGHGHGGELIGLCVRRSFDLVVGLLGILKAGAAYVPLDPEYPAERIEYVIKDAGLKIVLTEPDLARADRDSAAEWWPLEKCSGFAPEDATRLKASAPKGDLAYVMYTSGSTGKPKGVAVPHSALTNHMLWMRAAYPLGPTDVVLQKTPFGFDASVWEILAPLISGARLVLAKPGGHKDPRYMCRAIQQHGVTTLQLVPSMLRLLLEEPEFGACTSLTNVFCGGEALTRDLYEELTRRLRVNLHNLYGPTETCIQSLAHTCRESDLRGPTGIPIGRPIWNTQVYVLDAQMRPVGLGDVGELYIGGACLARGYLGQPELTSQRFVSNPFSGADSKLYRTGDMVRYLPTGELEFVGRNDQQVKLHGNRIELAECEAALQECAGVRHAAVIVRENTRGESHLAAYVVAKVGSSIDENALRDELRRRLPDYMVPGSICCMAALPLLSNGKLDRNALPDPQATASEGKTDAPTTPSEKALFAIWREVLETDNFGIKEDFFDLGGTSLTLIRMFALANRQFGSALELSAVANGATIADLSPLFERNTTHA